MSDAPLRVLLVEDESLNRALVRAILARSDGQLSVALQEAPTIGAAREALGRNAVDVVLLDVRLPDGSGLDLARELSGRRAGRPEGAGRQRPLVAILSASVLAGEREAAETAGADAFLGKPFAPRDLLALLERFQAQLAARPASADPSADA